MTEIIPPRPRATSVLTVLIWNLLVLIALAAEVIYVLANPHTGEDWSGVIGAILIIYGGGALLIATVAGVLIARGLSGRALRAGRPLSKGAGIGVGTLSAALGWVIPVVGIIAYTLLSR